MIVTQPKANVVTQGVQGAVSFGIKQEGLAHIFNVLRNQLYSDKILAVLREYSCNAVDAHVEAGHNRPIHVTLPSRLQLELKIRDYGLGLSDKDIQEIYAFYGESTKRKSNSLIGQLGLGSKSAFAYGDNFVINSFHDGVKTTYNAYIDASQIGQIAKLASVATTEENGVEIVIPVKPSDCENFVETAKRLFRFFKVRPMISGVAEFQYEAETVSYSGDDWRIVQIKRYGGNHSFAIMGNIAYSLNASALKLDSDNNDDDATVERLLGHCCLHIDFNIGDLDIAASREGLQYTDRTIANIKSRVLAIRDFLVDKITKELKGANSLWSFKRMLGDMHDCTSPYYAVCQAMRGKSGYDYKGQIIKNTNVDFSNSKGFKMHDPRKGYVGGSYVVKGSRVSEANYMIPVNSKVVIVENTRKLKTQIVNYLYSLLSKDNHVILCEFLNAKDRKAQLDNLGIADSDIIDMATLPKMMLPRHTRRASTSSGVFANRSKHTSKVFKLDNSQGYSSYHTTKSDFWVEDDVDFDKLDTTKFCFVQIDRFVGQLPNKMEIQPYHMNEALKFLGTLISKSGAKNLHVPTIIGIKGESQLKKVAKTKLRNLHTFVADSLKEVEAQTNCSQILYGEDIYSAFASQNTALTNVLRKLIDANSAPNTHRLLEEIIALNPSGDNILIGSAFKTLCGNFGIKRSNVSGKRSDALDKTEAKAKKLAHNLRLLQFTDAWCFQEYRDTHKDARNAGLDYIVTRDAELASV